MSPRIVVTAQDVSSGREANALIDSDPAVSAADVVSSLAGFVGSGAGAAAGEVAPRASGGAIDVSGSFGASGIMDGSIIQFGGSTNRATQRRSGPVDLCFTGGTGAGRVERLDIGEFVMAVDPRGGLRFGGAPGAGLDAAVILVGMDGSVRIRSLAATTSMILDETPLTMEPRTWRHGVLLRAQGSVLTVLPAARPDADLRSASTVGQLDYNRPPRLLPATPRMRFHLPATPKQTARSPLPWIGAALPMLLGITTAFVFQNAAYLMFALATPLMVIGNWIVSRRNGKKSYRRTVEENKAERAAILDDVADAVLHEQEYRRSSTPGAAELRTIATTPTRRLWERRVTDPDYLHVRLGLADRPSNVELDDMEEREHRRRRNSGITSVPVVVSLPEAGVVGIAGTGDWPRERAAWLVGQMAVLHSPRDVQIWILSSTEVGSQWHWAGWLPHVRPALGQDALALVGTTTETTAQRLAELSAIVDERQQSVKGSGSRDAEFAPNMVVVLDGARRLRALPGVVTLLKDGPAVGVYLICIDSDEQQLPEECTAVVLRSTSDELVVKRQQTDDVTSVTTDDVESTWFAEVSRAMTPIRDVSDSESTGLIPDSAKLVEVLGLGDIEERDMVARWTASRGTTEAVIGVSIDGNFGLDLVRDGPHALVAGTTGSGKSEFLQSLVAALAIANTPEKMTFVLVDYKGGAAFSQCADLPHTVGMVTDLDPHLVERALQSLRAELVYREQQLATLKAKDLEDYEDAIVRGATADPMPRLVIVIDEFAAMAKELPDFVAGLVSIAQRGRSLGIHLVLATQRPSGVISAEIRANTNLRIALRMTDAGESSDVINAPDAGHIPKGIPGRAFARLGHTSLIPFQTARVGGRRTSAVDLATVEPPFLAAINSSDFGSPAPRRPVNREAVAADTDLSAIVESLKGANREFGFAEPRRPWLPALPDEIALASLPTESAASPGFAWGLEDHPDEQRQAPARIDLDDFGHLYLIGGPGSGRSTALRTIASSAALSMSPADLHLYAIDCGNGALAVLDELPHCGAVVQRTQPQRAVRLLTRLRTEMLRRQDVLAEGRFANIVEQRAGSDESDRLPHIVVAIDRWETFVSTIGDLDSGSMLDTVQAMLRDSAGVGIHFIIAGDRALLMGRMATLCDDKILLRLTDRSDSTLAGISTRTLPTEIQPGRGFRGGSATELHIAILGSDATGRGQSDAVRALAAGLPEASASAHPFRVDELPKALDLEAAYRYAGPESEQPLWAMVGVGGDQLAAVGIDLARDSPTFIIGGPPRSGRSTMLSVMAESLLRGGTELVIATPRMSPLRDLEGRAGVRAVIIGREIEEEQLASVLEPDGQPVVLIVDDAELVSDIPAKGWLRTFLSTAQENRRGVIIAGATDEVARGFSGWQIDVKKNRRGALLSPQSSLDGDLVGVRLPRSSASATITPGRALVHMGTGQLESLLIPHVMRQPV